MEKSDHSLVPGGRPTERMTALKAIREFCFECCDYSSDMVKACSASWCPLHAFRLGRNPRRAGIGDIKTLDKGPHR